jgi:hypothetical protein
LHSSLESAMNSGILAGKFRFTYAPNALLVS